MYIRAYYRSFMPTDPRRDTSYMLSTQSSYLRSLRRRYESVKPRLIAVGGVKIGGISGMIMRNTIKGMMGLATIALAGCANTTSEPLTDAQIGPKPPRPAMVEAVTKAVKLELKDPYSAKISWPYAFVRGDRGYWTCGIVNAKNSYGAYNGSEYVSAVIAGGKVTFVQFDHESYGKGCGEDVQDGTLTRIS